MTDPVNDSVTVREPWSAPALLGSRACWFDGERNVTIPVVRADPTHTDGRGLDGGWNALLPTENAAEVFLLWDPESPEDEPQCSLWLYVEHPEYGYLIDACLAGPQRDGSEWWIVYDPACGGPTCEGWCRWCGELEHHFMEYVTTPQEVLDRLAWLGSLPLRAARHGRTSEDADRG